MPVPILSQMFAWSAPASTLLRKMNLQKSLFVYLESIVQGNVQFHILGVSLILGNR